MNPRRRTTMNVGDGSGIPQPSMLRGPRASMAPSMFNQGPPSAMRAARKSEASGLLGAQTPAHGNRGLFGGNAPMSHARNPAAGRLAAQTPATNRANRRVSVFASSRRNTMSLAVPGTATRNGTAVKDPRPLRDRSFQSKAQQRIMNYLSTHGYPGLLTPKTLATPTVKDFQTIFKFLYAQLDPRYMYVKKFEEEVLIILRGIHYPYVNNISKSHIYSAGSLSTWPGLLAMLLWLVELIECVKQMSPEDVDVNDPEFKDSVQFVDRVFFDYLSQAYPLWLDSGDEPAELEERLAKQFEQKNASLIQETADVERRLANAKMELDALLSNESSLVQLERERVELIADKKKFENYIQLIENKHQRIVDLVATQKQQQDAAQFEQLALEKEKSEVQKIVDEQQISTDDVDRMNSERNQLLETLKGVQEKSQEVMQEVWDRELKLQRALDDIESLAQDYRSKALKLGLVGARQLKATQSLGEVDKDINMAGSELAESGLPESAKDDPLGGLTVLGLVLERVFSTESAVVVFGITGVLGGMAALEVSEWKAKRTVKGMFWITFVSIFGSAITVGLIGSAFAMNFDPPFIASKFIPVMGMLFGNTIVGVALGMESVLVAVDQRRDAVEIMLCYGASRWESLRPIAVEAARTAMVPSITSMSITGLISIPGMMSGQILGGADVMDAARYQQVIVFMISASVALGVVISVTSAAFIVVDSQPQLRPERIVNKTNFAKSKSTSGLRSPGSARSCRSIVHLKAWKRQQRA
ncbi:kinetochore-associated Ndc80 complex subunit ndc80 [Coemansia brasiliensis]|uniref:Kinetochore protein NDC80 n=1 Tax=Coemansia brasiliensis TaxID=2650707 RepID=A0A9W8IBN6_9FUNG|nr:kinetochore-associated Ndc80 complex subunit ndc80 [Coemansia brasiliensis]